MIPWLEIRIMVFIVIIGNIFVPSYYFVSDFMDGFYDRYDNNLTIIAEKAWKDLWKVK